MPTLRSMTSGTARGGWSSIYQTLVQLFPPRSGEAALHLGLLDNAVHTLETPVPFRKLRFSPAYERALVAAWIAGAPAPISFATVCLMLGIEPAILRPLLLRKYRAAVAPERTA